VSIDVKHPIPHGPERIARISDCSGSVSGYGKRSRREAQDAPGGLGDQLGELAVLWFLLSRSVTSPSRICWSAARGKRRWRNALPGLRDAGGSSLAAFPLARSGRAAVRAYCSPEPQDSRRRARRASGLGAPCLDYRAPPSITRARSPLAAVRKAAAAQQDENQRRPEHQRQYGVV